MSREVINIRGITIQEMVKSVPHFTGLLLGSRGAGKSVMVHDIMYNIRFIGRAQVFSQQEINNDFFKVFVGDLFIFDEISEELIYNFWVAQSNLIRLAKQKYEQTKKETGVGKKTNVSILLVFDDCQSTANKWSKYPVIKQIFLEGRHRKITFLMTMQYVVGMDPTLRSNFDYVFIFHAAGRTTQEKIYKEYGGVFDNFMEFRDAMNSLCTDRSCMIVKIRSDGTTSVNEKVFHYRAHTNIPPFSFGCKTFKKYFDENYDKDWQDRDYISMNMFSKGKDKGKGKINDKNNRPVIVKN